MILGGLGCQPCEPSCGWAVPLANHRESRGLSTEPQSLGKSPPGQGHRGRKWGARTWTQVIHHCLSSSYCALSSTNPEKCRIWVLMGQTQRRLLPASGSG